MKSNTDNTRKRADRVARLHMWLDDGARPDGDLMSIARELHNVRELFLEELAERLQDPINAHFSALPQETVTQKSQICSDLNALLTSFGLGLRDSGSVGIISADQTQAYPSGRYRVSVSGERPHTRKWLSRSLHLPPLELAPRPYTDTRSSWVKRVLAHADSEPRGR